MSYTAGAAVLASHQIRLRCISRIDSYLFKVEDAEKLEMKVTFVDCLCVNLQSGEAVCRILVIFNNKN
ncbi:hypothetical protein Tco_1067130 [Tanacetum coccineum]|uniref:Uncharacterized protein n=1 Tax=Tanacetum coccineum TaxID=301880 RepID=A0ABQ5HBZ4_9ASTR